MSRNWVRDIAEMHAKFKFHEDLEFTGDFLKFRQHFLEEEMIELDDAIRENDPEKVVDALIDLCVVAIGTLDLGGINSFRAWNAVHKANMLKDRADNPTRKGSGGFDLVKPEGWVPPTHKKNLGKFIQAVEELSKKQHPIPSHIKTLHEFAKFAESKTHDYDDNSDPEFQHFTHYPDGIKNIMYEIGKKVKRINVNLRRMFSGGSKPLTDSLDDSFKDISIYAAIGHNVVNGTLEGQEGKDMFGRKL